MILITGAYGQLGKSLVNCLKQQKVPYTPCGRQDFDITNKIDTERYIVSLRPNVVIHCAAYSNVEQAEVQEDQCFTVNLEGTANVARSCEQIQAKMIYISTDYVFDGTKETPYEIDDTATPLSVYGKSKFEGEKIIRECMEAHFIIRISWLFGEGNNFVQSILKQTNKQCVQVVEDQVGSPTFADDLSLLLFDMTKSDSYGTFHATNEGFCSFAEWAEEIYRIANLPTKVERVPSFLYPTKAQRPLNSRLSKNSLDKAGISRLPSWQNALERYMNQIDGMGRDGR